MGWKTAVIGVLVATAVLLGGIVASGLREERAYAQGGVYATFLATSALVQSDQVNFAILDTESRRLLFYKVDPARSKLEPTAGRFLVQDVKQVLP